MYILFLSILIILFAVVIVISTISEKKYKNVAMTEKMKCNDYYQTIAMLWGMVLLVAVMCLIGNINVASIGLRHISFNYNIWFSVIVLIIGGLFLVFMLFQTIQLLTSTKAREEAIKKIAPNEGAGQVLPRTKKEKWLFSLVSLSAGICEEIIFRGFLVFLLQAVLPSVPLYIIVIISSLLFGLSHMYQGWQGIIKTGIMGAFLLILVIATDSLILAMILHFLVDLSSTFLLSDEHVERV